MRRDQWSAAAVTAGLAYLVWRAAATLGGVPPWLSVPALLVEVAGWVGFVVIVAVVRRRPLPALESAPRLGDLADVVVRVDGQPLPLLLATLAGVRHADGVCSVTILDFADRADVRGIGAEHGIPVVAVPPHADAAGLQTALGIGSASLLAVLDAGDVPTPHFLGVLARHADDGYVAAVVGRLDQRATDSAEHDLSGHHERRLDRELLNPSAGPAAVIGGSGTLLRRWAIAHVGVPGGSRRGVEMRLSARLRRAGLRVVAPAEPVVVWERAVNSARAVSAIRRRETAGVVEWLRSPDTPVLSRGLSWRDRFALSTAVVRPLAGARRAGFLAVVIASLLAARLPLSATPLELATIWLPYQVLRALAWHTVTGSSQAFGESARWSFRTMGASTHGLLGAGRARAGTGISSPRVGGWAALSANRTLTAALALLVVLVPVVAVSDRLTGWLPAMDGIERAMLFAAAIWSILQMLDVVRGLTASSQLRRSARVPIAEAGRVDDFPATFVDLTPYGAGALVDGAGFAEPLQVGDPVTFLFEVATLSGRRARASGTAVVRSARHTRQGYLCGLEFTSTDFASSDAIYEFCEVVYAARAVDVEPPHGSAPDRATPPHAGGSHPMAAGMAARPVLVGAGAAMVRHSSIGR